ncbi:hypothetical protein ACFE04_014913 [Oxalis oulophora]
MEEGRRSGEPEIIVKRKSSSGCLIVRKKNVDGVGVGGVGVGASRKHDVSKKEKKRSRIVASDVSGSGDDDVDDIIMRSHRRFTSPETMHLTPNVMMIGGSEFARKRNNREEESISGSDRKRNKVDASYEFDRYKDLEMRRKGTFDNGRSEIDRRRLALDNGGGIEQKFDAGSSMQMEKRTKMYFDRNSHFERGGGYVDRSSFDLNRDDRARMSISLLREKYGDSDKPIRVQGKNGVLKVMVNKRKNIGAGFSNGFGHFRPEENGKHSRIDNTLKRNVLLSPTFNSDVPGSSSKTQKNKLNLQKPLPPPSSKGSDFESEDSEIPFKPRPKKLEVFDPVKTLGPKKNDKISDHDSESETMLKLGPKNVEAGSSKKKASGEGSKTPTELPVLSHMKEGKVKRGSGTEKQRLREKIRAMLQTAGWTIDYRPRRNRDYLDAVYISPSGTAFWSIIKAYEAFQKQLADDSAPFDPLSDEILSQLTRKTQKKMEREMRMKKGGAEDKIAKKSVLKKSSSSKQVSKSFKGSIATIPKIPSPVQNLHAGDDEGPFSASKSVQGRNTRKLGRCTLLVRPTNDASNSETDGFVPYAGKRTVLSWLIDTGTVQSSQKVQYMNRRRKNVMLEGWVTRDGIHCGCCSKILTVWKFEVHAGSKLRQPFQNICLDTGASLLQCQIDAWNKQEESERNGFNTVDTTGDDPNDDACGICGDGGDLICCDGCPSTFHQSCLDIQMLPAGDWHCPNCTCKFCGFAKPDVSEGNDSIDCGAVFNCIMCEKKYHKSCMLDMVDFDCSLPFCGRKCRELFEHLDRHLGVKHELESGFSWSLIRRTDADTDKRGIAQTVENNSKLAVALTIMYECFLPITDKRSGINVIKSVLYNCRSNFHRLNYNGFYTAILERGDEMISAASLRFHGTQLAEMPFIGTRHIHRRQGMCRKLLSAIETALGSMKVEKLVIPAISELTHTWTSVFGFTHLQSASKQEIRSLNMLAFPGIDMLHKLIVENKSTETNKTVEEGTKVKELNFEKADTPKGETKSDSNSSAQHDIKERDDDILGVENETNSEVTPAVSNPVVSLNEKLTCDCTEASGEQNVPAVVEETGNDDSQSGNSLAEPASTMKCLPIEYGSDELEKEDKLASNSPIEYKAQSSEAADTNDDLVGAVTVASTPCTDNQLTDKQDGCNLDDEGILKEAKIKVQWDSSKDKEKSSLECEMDYNHVVNVNMNIASAADNDGSLSFEGADRNGDLVGPPVTVVSTPCIDQLTDKQDECDPDDECSLKETEIKAVLSSSKDKEKSSLECEMDYNQVDVDMNFATAADNNGNLSADYESKDKSEDFLSKDAYANNGNRFSNEVDTNIATAEKNENISADYQSTDPTVESVEDIPGKDDDDDDEYANVVNRPCSNEVDVNITTVKNDENISVDHQSIDKTSESVEDFSVKDDDYANDVNCFSSQKNV